MKEKIAQPFLLSIFFYFYCKCLISDLKKTWNQLFNDVAGIIVKYFKFDCKVYLSFRLKFENLKCLVTNKVQTVFFKSLVD